MTENIATLSMSGFPILIKPKCSLCFQFGFSPHIFCLSYILKRKRRILRSSGGECERIEESGMEIPSYRKFPSESLLPRTLFLLSCVSSPLTPEGPPLRHWIPFLNIHFSMLISEQQKLQGISYPEEKLIFLLKQAEETLRAVGCTLYHQQS